MGAPTKIGISKEQRIQGEKYARRFGLHTSKLIMRRRKGKVRTIYLIGHDENDIQYRVRFDKVIRMRKPMANQIVSKLERFNMQAEEIHGNKYDWSKVKAEDLGYLKEFKVKCNTKGHGTFKTNRNRFILDAKGCPKCGRQRLSNSTNY